MIVAVLGVVALALIVRDLVKRDLLHLEFKYERRPRLPRGCHEPRAEKLLPPAATERKCLCAEPRGGCFIGEGRPHEQRCARCALPFRDLQPPLCCDWCCPNGLFRGDMPPKYRDGCRCAGGCGHPVRAKGQRG